MAPHSMEAHAPRCGTCRGQVQSNEAALGSSVQGTLSLGVGCVLSEMGSPWFPPLLLISPHETNRGTCNGVGVEEFTGE